MPTMQNHHFGSLSNNGRTQQQSNVTSCLQNEPGNGAKTSDLGDEEIPPNSLECDINNMMAGSAPINGHLTLHKDTMSSNNSNSDGTSSGQRSILTLSSSGQTICTNLSEPFEHQTAGKQPHHPQCHQAGCNLAMAAASGAKHTEDSDPSSRGGSVIGVTVAHPNGQLKRPDSTSTNGIIKQAKKSVSSLGGWGQPESHQRPRLHA